MATARKSAATVQTPGAAKTKTPRAPRAAAPTPTGDDAAGDPIPAGGVAELAAARFTDEDVDPTTLSSPVMTPDGWLCPEPKPAKA